MCCDSNGGISDEWGKLFLPLSWLQKETKTPFTSANNALMWAPAPRRLHKPGSVQAADRHTGLWGHSQGHPLLVGEAGLGKAGRSTTPGTRGQACGHEGCLPWPEVWPPPLQGCRDSSQAGERRGHQ